MDDEIKKAHEHFIKGLSRIAYFWGFSKAMGATYGTIYLSPKPLTLDDIVKRVGISKGAVSTNVRYLERLGMVHKRIKIGDRKDYYIAETEFWKLIKGILREREKNEFDRALRTVGESLDMVQCAKMKKSDAELTCFYIDRMEKMKVFFDKIDKIVAMILALDEFRISTIERFFCKENDK